MDIIANELSLIDWSDVLHSNCPNKASNLLYTKFYSLFDQHFPIKTIKLNKKKQVSSYITSGPKNSIIEKHRLERLAKIWPIT